MKYKCILWDWNGTVIDDMPVSLRAVNKILADRGRAPICKEEYYEYIDTPITKFYERLFDLEKEDMDTLIREFNENYDSFLDGSEVSDEVRKGLKAVCLSGAKQIILSSSEAKKLTRLIGEYGLTEVFSAILGSDDFVCSSKVERAQGWFAAEGVSPAEAVILGDTLHDAEVAREIGCDCILVSCGHQSKKELLSAGYPVKESVADALKLIIEQ